MAQYKNCECCGSLFKAKRSNARYCELHRSPQTRDLYGKNKKNSKSRAKPRDIEKIEAMNERVIKPRTDIGTYREVETPTLDDPNNLKPMLKDLVKNVLEEVKNEDNRKQIEKWEKWVPIGLKLLEGFSQSYKQQNPYHQTRAQQQRKQVVNPPKGISTAVRDGYYIPKWSLTAYNLQNDETWMAHYRQFVDYLAHLNATDEKVISQDIAQGRPAPQAERIIERLSRKSDQNLPVVSDAGDLGFTQEAKDEAIMSRAKPASELQMKKQRLETLKQMKERSPDQVPDEVLKNLEDEISAMQESQIGDAVESPRSNSIHQSSPESKTQQMEAELMQDIQEKVSFLCQMINATDNEKFENECKEPKKLFNKIKSSTYLKVMPIHWKGAIANSTPEQFEQIFKEQCPEKYDLLISLGTEEEFKEELGKIIKMMQGAK